MTCTMPSLRYNRVEYRCGEDYQCEACLVRTNVRINLGKFMFKAYLGREQPLELDANGTWVATADGRAYDSKGRTSSKCERCGSRSLVRKEMVTTCTKCGVKEDEQ